MKTSNIFPMPHHEESPEKTQYGNPSFLDKPNPILPYPLLFCQKFSDPPHSPSHFPISINFEKKVYHLPPSSPLFALYKRGEGFELCEYNVNELYKTNKILKIAG